MMRDMRGTAYKALGFVVFNGGKAFIKRRYSNQLKVAGGSAAVLLVGSVAAAVLLGRKHGE